MQALQAMTHHGWKTGSCASNILEAISDKRYGYCQEVTAAFNTDDLTLFLRSNFSASLCNIETERHPIFLNAYTVLPTL
jgi:hypothetical protein